MTRPGLALLLICIGLYAIPAGAEQPPVPAPTLTPGNTLTWSAAELATLRSLWIGSQSPLPPDPSNVHADDPQAAAFGKKLFFETRFSANGAVACASCHQPERHFTDGLVLGRGIGEAARNTPTIVGAAYSAWLFWDGRRDSLWAQALAPIENATEEGGNRARLAHVLYADPEYRKTYEALFGAMPDLSDRRRFPDAAGPVADPQAATAWAAMADADRAAVDRIFANAAKAIAAYERGILPGPSRFDSYVEDLLQHAAKASRQTLTADEISGLRLFIGKAKCVMCHNGPQFSNHEFHNTGVPPVPGAPRDEGHYQGVREALADEFNCLGDYSDAGEGDCAELRFAKQNRLLLGTFKVPSLRDVAATAPYFHTGRFATLAQVIEHYNRMPIAKVGQTELRQLNLTATEKSQLKAFLRALSSYRIE